MPEISVVIPTHNRVRLLQSRALPSALRQEGVDHEIIVVDDGSEDETAHVLARLAASDARVHALHNDRPCGVAAARNVGIHVARAPWIAFLDDDDLWAPWKLAAQLEAVKRNSADWGYAGAIAVTANGEPLYEYYSPDPALVAEQLLQSAVVPAGASNVLVRTEVVRSIGGFDERFFQIEDWDLWIRLSERGVPAVVADVLVAVLVHSQNKHAVNDHAEELCRLIFKHASRRPPRVLDVDVVGYSRWVAGQHSRTGLHRKAAWLYARDAWRHRSPTNLLRAADALTNKRVSARLRRTRRGGRPPAPAPEWLQQFAA